MTLILLIFIAIPVVAGENFTVITKDNEVGSIEQVQVKRSESVISEEILTLQYLNTQIAALEAKLQEYNQKLAELKALKIKVEEKAEAVKLKQPEPQE